MKLLREVMATVFEAKSGERVLFWTQRPEAIPRRKVRAAMRAAGLKLFLDGKPFKEADAATK